MTNRSNEAQSVAVGTSAHKDRRQRRFPLVVAGLFFGVAASQTLPAATVLVGALNDAGVKGTVAELIVMAVFAIGGVEGSLLVLPLVSKIKAGRKRR